MATPPRILVLSGSARSASVNTLLAGELAAALSAAGAECELTSLRDFPVPPYDFDHQHRDGVPEPAVRLGRLINDSDGFALVSPEYNHSVPGTVKNLIDWVSRIKPWPFTDRGCLLASASPGELGGSRGLAALRVPLAALKSRVHPETFSLSAPDGVFDDDGRLVDPDQRDRLAALVAGWLPALRSVPATA